MKYLWLYLLLINIAAFIVWCTDKWLAKKSKRRISEKSLFLWALLGGSLGSLCAMHVVRHKTRHWYFVLGIPVIFAAQTVLLFYIITKAG